MKDRPSLQYPKAMVAAPAEQASLNLDQLYASELPYLYGFLCRLGAGNSDLEDLTHDVFVTAVRRWNTFDTSRPIRPWLLGIAFKVMADFRRKNASSREVLVDAPEVADGGATGEDRVARREAHELIQLALASLEPERRAVFVMYELEGISVADISESMGTPQATTYTRLRVGREEFTEAVRRIQLRRGES